MALSYGCLPLDKLWFVNDPLHRFSAQNFLPCVETEQYGLRGPLRSQDGNAASHLHQGPWMCKSNHSPENSYFTSFSCKPRSSPPKSSKGKREKVYFGINFQLGPSLKKTQCPSCFGFSFHMQNYQVPSWFSVATCTLQTSGFQMYKYHT